MRAFVCSVTVWALAVGLAVNAVAGRAFAQTTEQQVAPEEPAAAKEPAATQPTIVRSGPEPAPAIAPFDAEQAKRHQEVWAKHLGVPVEVTNSIGMKLVLIPPGEFVMGSPESEADRRGDEGPQHRVRITKPSYMGIHEVTVGQFQWFVTATGYKQSRIPFAGFKGNGSWLQPGFPQDEHCPVVNVAQYEAREFCGKLSTLEQRRYCLPTEAQWEYSCRAGSTTCFSFGGNPTQLKDHAWTSAEPSPRTNPVGQKSPNSWGLYDMHGNIWEWCQDEYDASYYRTSPAEDPPGKTIDGPLWLFKDLVVRRGGGWDSPSSLCRSARREASVRIDRYNFTGFRVALDVAEKAEPPKEGK